MMNSAHPIVVDICWTLYRSNTTFDFLDYAVRNPGYLRLRRWMRYPLVRKANLLLLRLLHHDILRARALRYLNQWSEEEIDQMAERFVSTQLETKRIEKVWDLLHKRDIIIVSGTISPIAEAVGQRLGAKKIYSGDIFKKQALTELTDYDIVTDNLSDKELIQKAHHAYIVTYGNRQRWDRMQLTNAEYITDEATRY